MIDAIVFNQDGLRTALDNGASHILLCDGSFTLPPVRGITYTAVGKVTAAAEASNPDDLGIVFSNFSPKLKKRPKTVHISNKAVGMASIAGSATSSYSSSYRSGSYGSSYRLSTSYRSGSYGSSYRLSTSYRFGSFGTSYTTSFSSSYRYSYRFASSLSSSYRLASSYKTSFASSFALASFAGGFKKRFYERVVREISVNGYGIHLV